MKSIIVLIVLVALVGCNIEGRPDIKNGTQIIKMDGCEYVIYQGYKCAAMVHHGNCHNYVHSDGLEYLFRVGEYSINIKNDSIYFYDVSTGRRESNSMRALIKTNQ